MHDGFYGYVLRDSSVTFQLWEKKGKKKNLPRVSEKKKKKYNEKKERKKGGVDDVRHQTLIVWFNGIAEKKERKRKGGRQRKKI